MQGEIGHPLSPLLRPMAKRIKIHDKQGYTYTVPIDGAGVVCDISSYTKIKHPNLFIDMRTAYSHIQFNALFRIIISLQPIIRNNFHQKSDVLLVQMQNVSWNRETHEVEITLPLCDFGVDSNHYSELAQALVDMSRIAVTFPQWSSLSQKELMTTGGLCRVAIDKRNRRQYLAHFFFSEQVVRTILDPLHGFSQILKETVDKIHSVYTAKLYFLICRWADKGRWVISYKELRQILNISKDKYCMYRDFRKRVLESSMQELMFSTNYWFSFHERFPQKSSIPDLIYFTIHSGNYSLQEKKNHQNRIARITDICSHMGVSALSTKMLVTKITPANSKYIYNKHSELVAFMEDHRLEINDQAAYYRQSLQNIIYKEVFGISDTQQELQFS